jgi:hypothetical protein
VCFGALRYALVDFYEIARGRGERCACLDGLELYFSHLNYSVVVFVSDVTEYTQRWPACEIPIRI